MDYAASFTPANPGSDYPVKFGNLLAQLSLDSDKVDYAATGYAFGYRRNATSGLTAGYYGGVIISGGSLSTIADGTILLTASQTNYVERTAAGVISKNTSGFTAGKIPMFTAVCNTTDITAVVDKRQRNVFGDLVAVSGISSGSVGGALGSLTLLGTTSGSAIMTVDATVTKVTLNKPFDTGANSISGGAISASGVFTQGAAPYAATGSAVMWAGATNKSTWAHHQQNTQNVAQVAVAIASGAFTAGAKGSGVFFVNGRSGTNIFFDIVIWSDVSSNFSVSTSTTMNGAPAARTYNQAGDTLTLTMASGTYSINCMGFESNNPV